MGRPSVQSSLRIKNELRRYFLQGYSAEFTSEQTGHNIKTVYKYFHDFAERITESDEENFLNRQKMERIRTIISFDSEIFDAKKHVQDIQNEIKKFKDEDNLLPRYLLSSYLEVKKHIANLIEARGSFIMKPAVIEKVREKLSEMADGQA